MVEIQEHYLERTSHSFGRQRHAVDDCRLGVDDNRQPPCPSRARVPPSVHGSPLDDDVARVLNQRFRSILHLEDELARDCQENG